MEWVTHETGGAISHPIPHIAHPLIAYFFRCVVATLLWVVLTASPDTALALLGDTEGTFGLDGRFSTLGALQDYYDFQPFFGNDSSDGLSQTLLRLIAAGRPTDQLSYEVQAVQSFNYASAGSDTESPLFAVGALDTRYRAVDLTWDWHTDDNSSAILWLDRANVKMALSNADLTVGRQPITFGKAYFWNPLDVFLPFDPLQFDRDYKPGVDAARLDVSWGPFTGLNLIAVAGRKVDASGRFINNGGFLDASWYGSAMLSHAFTTYEGWDLALQGGKIYGGYQLGGGLVGEIGPIETRVEAAYFWAQSGSEPVAGPQAGDLIEDNFTAAVGVGHRFDNSLTLQLEYFYNGSGDSDDLNASFVRFITGNILQMSRNLTGFLISYEFLPILLGQLIWLQSWDNPSSSIQPIISWSATDNIDLLLGANINLGERPTETPALILKIRSEFGTFPNLYFFQFKWYF